MLHEHKQVNLPLCGNPERSCEGKMLQSKNGSPNCNLGEDYLIAVEIQTAISCSYKIHMQTMYLPFDNLRERDNNIN